VIVDNLYDKDYHREYYRTYRLNNIQKIKTYNKTWHKEKRAYVNARRRASFQIPSNKERINTINKTWREKNPDKVRRLSGNNVGNTTFNDNFDFKRNYYNQFGRFIPYDFINQVIPVIFKVTGEETIDVVTLPPGKFCDTSCKTLPTSSTPISTEIVKIPSGATTKVRLAVRNTGDAPIYDMDTSVTPGVQSALGINGLTPSATTSPNIPQTLVSTILPVGIVGGSDGLISVPELPANSLEEFDVRVFPTHYVAETVELLNLNVTYNNIIGERVSQTNQIYFYVAPPPTP